MIRIMIRPVSDYTVEIQDDEGNGFPGDEMEPGLVRMLDGPGIPGSRDILQVDRNHCNGNQYVSDFDKMLPCPDY